MNITLGDYRINADAYSYQISQRKIGKSGKSKGLERWKPIEWFSTIEGCVNSLAKKKLMTSDASTIKELREVCDQFLKDVSAEMGKYHVA